MVNFTDMWWGGGGGGGGAALGVERPKAGDNFLPSNSKLPSEINLSLHLSYDTWTCRELGSRYYFHGCAAGVRKPEWCRRFERALQTQVNYACVSHRAREKLHRAERRVHVEHCINADETWRVTLTCAATWLRGRYDTLLSAVPHSKGSPAEGRQKHHKSRQPKPGEDSVLLTLRTLSPLTNRKPAASVRDGEGLVLTTKIGVEHAKGGRRCHSGAWDRLPLGRRVGTPVS